MRNRYAKRNVPSCHTDPQRGIAATADYIWRVTAICFNRTTTLLGICLSICRVRVGRTSNKTVSDLRPNGRRSLTLNHEYPYTIVPSVPPLAHSCTTLAWPLAVTLPIRKVMSGEPWPMDGVDQIGVMVFELHA